MTNGVDDDLVEKGAGLVHDGHMEVEDLEIPTRVKEAPGEVEFTAEELRDAVREFLDEHTPSPEQDSEDDEPDHPVTDGIDWQALWEEFGFDTKGPHGTFFANPIQLSLALEVSDQAHGNPDELIEHAVEKEILVRVTADGPMGGTNTRGYALQRGGGS